MKRVTVWLSVMVCFFGSYQLYAAGGIGYWIGYAIGHKWSWWVILLIVFFGIGFYLEDRKKKDGKKDDKKK